MGSMNNYGNTGRSGHSNAPTRRARGRKANKQPVSDGIELNVTNSLLSQTPINTMNTFNPPMTNVMQNQMSSMNKSDVKDEKTIVPPQVPIKPHLIELQVTVEETDQRFKVYFNKNVHKTLDEYKNYLSISLRVSDPSTFALRSENNPYFEITDVNQLANGLELVLGRKQEKTFNKTNEILNDIGLKQSQVTFTTGSQQRKRDEKRDSKRDSKLEKMEDDEILMSRSQSRSASQDHQMEDNTGQQQYLQQRQNQEQAQPQQQDPIIQRNDLMDLMQKVRQFNQQTNPGALTLQKNVQLPNQPLSTGPARRGRPKRGPPFMDRQPGIINQQNPTIQTDIQIQSSESSRVINIDENTIETEARQPQLALAYPKSYYSTTPFLISRVEKRWNPLELFEQPQQDSVQQESEEDSDQIVIEDQSQKSNRASVQEVSEENSVEVDMSCSNLPLEVNNKIEQSTTFNNRRLAYENSNTANNTSSDYQDISTQIKNILNKNQVGRPAGNINTVQNQCATYNNRGGILGAAKDSNTVLTTNLKSARGRKPAYLQQQIQQIRQRTEYTGRTMNQRNEYEQDQIYTKITKLIGFEPWQDWVPMPYPHRELSIARQMYTKGDKLVVATPDFVDFANDISNITSRNRLIYRCKRMMMERGIRSNLQFSGTGEIRGISITVLCSRSGKAPSCYKNPSMKNGCPFVIHFIRKSCLQDHEINKDDPSIPNVSIWHKKQKKQITLTDQQAEEFDNEDLIFRTPAKQLKGNEDDTQYFEFTNLDFRSQNYQNQIFNVLNMNEVSQANGGNNPEEINPNNPLAANMNPFSKMLEDIDIEGDPFFLQKYRAFHNHEVDTNLIENEALVKEKDVFRKGTFNQLPQSLIAIQEYSGQRRREINDERIKRDNKTISYEECLRMHENMKTGNYSYIEDDFEGCEFEQVEKATTIYKVDPGDPDFDQICSVRIIEPLGMVPQFIVVDMTAQEDSEIYPARISLDSIHEQRASDLSGVDSKWPPLKSQINYCREMVMDCYYKILGQVEQRFDLGIYNLDKYRRVFESRKRFRQERQKIDRNPNANRDANNPRRGRGRKANPNTNQKLMNAIEQIRQVNQLEDIVNSDEETNVNQFNFQFNNGRPTYDQDDDEEDENNYSIYD